jgi:hypothetical protein
MIRKIIILDSRIRGIVWHRGVGRVIGLLVLWRAHHVLGLHSHRGGVIHIGRSIVGLHHLAVVFGIINNLLVGFFVGGLQFFVVKEFLISLRVGCQR